MRALSASEEALEQIEAQAHPLSATGQVRTRAFATT